MGRQSSQFQNDQGIAKTRCLRKDNFIYRCCKQAVVLVLKAYQCLSRALLLRNCRFYPSCSQYAIDAIERFGVFQGAKKAIFRILRCSPATDGGYDPVR